MYRKVASSRPVYYSIFDHFGGATNQDVLLSETCYYCYICPAINSKVIYFSYQNVGSSMIPIRTFQSLFMKMHLHEKMKYFT